ncbi:MAG: TIGR00730 family Rossman fold protein [Rhizomicrobium sp.]
MVTRGKSVCVFCGSSHGADPRFAEAARRLGAMIAARGYRLVFGGGGIGLMGETARAARDAGAEVIGVIPSFLRHLEPPMRGPDELVVVPSLFERKERMMALADAFIVMPGGLGTMDEFFEVVGSAQLQRHDKPIMLVDIDGYFAPLLALIDHIVRSGFAHYEFASHFRVVASPGEALARIDAAFTPAA